MHEIYTDILALYGDGDYRPTYYNIQIVLPVCDTRYETGALTSTNLTV